MSNRTCATCAKLGTCFYSSSKTVDCTKHEPKPETNYERLFGTPEKAARTLFSDDRHADCADCMIHDGCYAVDFGCLVEDYDTLLGWLKGASDE